MSLGVSLRQAVISVYKNNGDGTYPVKPDYEITSRAPNHNLGLSFTFSFTKSLEASHSNCTLNINNVSNEMQSAFAYDPKDLNTRPKVEIRAGETDYTLPSKGFLPILKSKLNLIYLGFPFYFTDIKLVGSKMFLVQLTDMSIDLGTQRVIAQFAAGTPILTVLNKLLNDYNIKSEIPDDLASDLSSKENELKTPYYINQLNLYSQVLPDFGKNYGFHFYIDEQNTVKFAKSGTPKNPGNENLINNRNGLIEYPSSLNWNFWEVKTFFARPSVFFPGQWVKVDATTTAYSPTGRNSYNEFGVKSGIIVAGKYNWNDETAEIIYTMSPDGNPVETIPMTIV